MAKAKTTRGSIIRRAPLSRTVIVSYRDPETGKRKQQWETVRGETEKLAQQAADKKLTELLGQLDTRTFVKPTKLTVGAFLEQWLNDYASTNTRAVTVQGYRAIVKGHLIPQLGSVPLVDLTPARIQAYYAHALTVGRKPVHKKDRPPPPPSGLSARTVLHHHTLLVEALSHAIKWGLLARNPAEGATPPRPSTKEIDTLDAAGVHRFLEVAKRSHYYPLIHLALYTGMRRSEILALRWKDIDLVRGSVQVGQTLHRLRGGQIVIEAPKSKKSRRSIALSPDGVIGLRAHRDREEALCAEFGIPFTDDRLIFCRPDGRPLYPDVVSERVIEIAERAGFHGLSLHDLRHTHASLMLRQNVHPKIVQERLGHSTIAITLDLYSHVAPGLQEAAALRFDEVLTPKAPTPSKEPVEQIG